MSFVQITNDYIKELALEIKIGQTSGEATNELSYRTSLGNYFKNVAAFIDPLIATIPEPKNQGKIGRPDWRFHDTQSMGVFGYVEAKGLDVNFNIETDNYIDQIKKYLTLGNPVILTDGVEFIIFSTPTIFTRYTIISKPIDWSKPQINYDLEVLFRAFFKHPGYRVITENQLVKEVAKRAKLLAEEVAELTELEPDEAESEAEGRTVYLLKNLKNIAEVYHDKTLESNEVFAGFVSQILTFGLLYSHRIIGASAIDPKEKYFKIHDFWFDVLKDEYSNKLLPFKSLVNELKDELNSSSSRLGIWYDDARRLLAHIKLTGTQIEKPDFHKLYEVFLSIYDPKTRFDYGAFYTPRDLAKYQVDLTEAIAKQKFNDFDTGALGIKYIDPCCGTGTFVELLVEKFGANKKPEIIGFEILPAPYALAHYRMTMVSNGYPQNVHIVLTNTLSDSLNETKLDDEKTVENIFSKEQNKANGLATPPLTFIIGNPPSSDSQFIIENEGKRLKALIDDFRPPAEDRKGRQNVQKQLRNEFVKFLRWSMERAILSKPSIVSLILPSSFAKHISYKYARKYLIENFSQLWILEFDTDTRSGKMDRNLFATLQGRLLLIGVVDNNKFQLNNIKYKSILNFSRAEKIEFFKNCDFDLNTFETVEIDTEDYRMKPKTSYDADLYDRFWSITNEDNTGIFIRHCSSIKLAPTHLLVHASAGQLKRRSKFIAKRENSYEEIKNTWYTGQTKPPARAKLTENVREKIGTAISNNKVSKYSYRPFLESFVLLDEDVLNALKNLEGGGTRDRPEVRVAFNNQKVQGFALAPAPEDISENLHKFSSFCWEIPDNDLSARGNAHVFCNYFPEYKKGQSTWDSSLKTNISEAFLSKLSLSFSVNTNDLINPIMFYSYAILSSSQYLQRFKGKLFDVAGQWPKIPITSSKTLFFEIAAIGQELAEIERDDYQINKVRSELLFTEFDGEFKLISYKFETNKILLIDDKKKIKVLISNIPEDLLLMEISGYKVLREWLKMRSYAYYRKTFEKSDYESLKILLEKIFYYQNRIAELNERFNQIFESPEELL